MTTNEVSEIKPGKCIRQTNGHYFAKVGLSENGSGWVVEGGWRVNEAADDDYRSAGYHPIRKDKKPVVCPWIGREYACATASEAAEMFDAVVVGAKVGKLPQGGKKIGSVNR